MKRLNKTQVARLNAAFAYAQKVMRTGYHFTYIPRTKAEMAAKYGTEDALMGMDETLRGSEDENHFIIEVNIDEIPGRSLKLLKKDAGHEVIHAILHKLYKSNTLKNCENATYAIQRACFGDDNE